MQGSGDRTQAAGHAADPGRFAAADKSAHPKGLAIDVNLSAIPGHNEPVPHGGGFGPGNIDPTIFGDFSDILGDLFGFGFGAGGPGGFTLTWDSGWIYTMEVYAPGASGTGAEVQSVETHALFVLPHEDAGAWRTISFSRSNCRSRPTSGARRPWPGKGILAVRCKLLFPACKVTCPDPQLALSCLALLPLD